jgi:hypothetical protein
MFNSIDLSLDIYHMDRGRVLFKVLFKTDEMYV